MQKPIYLDNHSTTPLDPNVFEAMKPYFLEHFGNPSSRHEYGWAAAQAVENARAQVAKLLGCLPKEIIFTSGATEANNLAIRGVLTPEKNHFITGNTEHKSVLEVAKALAKEGQPVTILECDSKGLITLEQVEAALRPNTALISLMFGNNEIGTLHPLEEIGRLAKSKGVLFHTDATQALGHLDVNVNTLNADLVSFSAHKFHGPKGIGALYVRAQNPRVKVRPHALGGTHEMGIRPGTLNVPGIVGLGAACEIAGAELPREVAHTARLRDRLRRAIEASVDGVSLNGPEAPRLPHNLSLTFEGVTTQGLLAGLHRSVALSAGSACTSPMAEASHVLKAIGHDENEARSTLRFGLSRYNTEDEIDRAAAAVIEAVAKARAAGIK
ncbi:MAG TPA: cysteine desulfurase family protein [Bdellovibrionales bacterium]|nr:cysteine desulfurase family protein [Bdellovibrionales bacterium]